MAAVSTLTVGEALRWASSLLLEAIPGHSPTLAAAPAEEQQAVARREAEDLLEHAAGWSRARLVAALAEHLPDTVCAAYAELVRRRAAGEPLQYITGTAWFYGRPFHVAPGCLIPRPETEVLVEEACRVITTQSPDAVVCDLGTGSGCIALTIALECKGARVIALDVSAEALALARRNGGALGARVEFIEADGLSWLAEHGRRRGLRVLVANPPYIASGDIDGLAADVRDWEPRLALDGGPDGLSVYRALAALGDACFAPGPAALLLEVGCGQAQPVQALFADSWRGWVFDTVPDLRGVPRVVRGFRLSD